MNGLKTELFEKLFSAIVRKTETGCLKPHITKSFKYNTKCRRNSTPTKNNSQLPDEDENSTKLLKSLVLALHLFKQHQKTFYWLPMFALKFSVKSILIALDEMIGSSKLLLSILRFVYFRADISTQVLSFSHAKVAPSQTFTFELQFKTIWANSDS